MVIALIMIMIKLYRKISFGINIGLLTYRGINYYNTAILPGPNYFNRVVKYIYSNFTFFVNRNFGENVEILMQEIGLYLSSKFDTKSVKLTKISVGLLKFEYNAFSNIVICTIIFSRLHANCYTCALCMHMCVLLTSLLKRFGSQD